MEQKRVNIMVDAPLHLKRTGRLEVSRCPVRRTERKYFGDADEDGIPGFEDDE